MTTLVCLISHQHVPNLLPVKAIRPDNLLLLVTAGMQQNSHWFVQALAVGGLDYSGRCTIINIKSENSVEEVKASLNAEYNRQVRDEWIINITGGTKPMSIGAHAFARENNLKAIYIVESDQYLAIDLSGGEPVALGNEHVSATEFLAGYGYEIRNVKDLDRQNEMASRWQDLGAILTLHHDDGEVQKFLAVLQGMKEDVIRRSRRKWEKEGLLLKSEDGLWISNADVRTRICNIFALREYEKVITGHLDRQAVEFLTGRWLEYFVYGLLVPLMPAYVRCVQVGLTVGQSGPGESNEFDLSFMAERAFCIVECKTGAQRHDPKGDAVLYKMEAIKAGLGAIRVNAFLTTTAPNVIDPVTGDTRESLKNRARIYNCSIIHGAKLKELASLYLAHDPSLDVKVAALFRLKGPS